MRCIILCFAHIMTIIGIINAILLVGVCLVAEAILRYNHEAILTIGSIEGIALLIISCVVCFATSLVLHCLVERISRKNQ